MHPKYQTKPAFGWVRKGSNPAVKTTSGRGRVNIHGALRLENFDAPFVEPVSVDGNSAVQLLAKIEARNPILTCSRSEEHVRINFITRRPGTENANYVSVGTGNYGLIEAETAFDITLSDELAVRLAGTYAEADGWLKNVNPGLDDAHSIDEYGVRLSVLWQARDDVELMLRASTAKSDPVNQGIKNINEYPPTWFGIYGLYKSFGGTTLSNPSQQGLGHYEKARRDRLRIPDPQLGCDRPVHPDLDYIVG